jgi:hypothetical protein
MWMMFFAIDGIISDYWRVPNTVTANAIPSGT